MDLGRLRGRVRTGREVGALAVGRRVDPRLRPWPRSRPSWGAVCNICGWRGGGFAGVEHSESAVCGVCGSVARDRFLYHCFTSRTPAPRRGGPRRVLETSPRLGADYRKAMRRRFDYVCSDYDLRAHRADLQLDLQAIDLPDADLDAVLSAHVLEHVPDYEAAIAEIFRVLRPGGVLFLSIPVVAATTAVPTRTEYHDDNTLVHWWFGFDVADDLRAAGFEARTLVPEELCNRIRARDVEWARLNPSPAHDPVGIVESVDPDLLTDVAGLSISHRLGFHPAYMFVVFEGRRPA